MTDITTDTASLTLDDVENAIWAIDASADQGAYKGWEATAKAFAVRERLVRFLNLARQNQQEALAAQTAQVTPPASTEVTSTPSDGEQA